MDLSTLTVLVTAFIYNYASQKQQVKSFLTVLNLPFTFQSSTSHVIADIQIQKPENLQLPTRKLSQTVLSQSILQLRGSHNHSICLHYSQQHPSPFQQLQWLYHKVVSGYFAKLLIRYQWQTYHIIHVCVHLCVRVYVLQFHNLWTLTRIGAYLYNAGNGVHNLTERSIVSQPQQQALFIFYMYTHPHFHVQESCLAPPR